MTIIRRLNCFDAFKIKKMIAYLGSKDRFSDDIMAEAFQAVHSFIPLKYKFLPESYVLLEDDEILGLITIAPTIGNYSKIDIIRLIFKQNMYDVGKQLIEFVIAKYGAKGAASFHVTVDQSHEELLNLFMNGCSFRHCSYKNLWKLDNFVPETDEIAPFRCFQNSDAKYVSALYNSELKNLYRPTLEKIDTEYKDPIFYGITRTYKNKYILEEPVKHKIIAYLSIATSDNFNFVIDMSLNDAYNVPYDLIINFALAQIRAKRKDFCAFLKHRQYTINADIFEEYLHKRNLNCIQTQCILTKDFYRQIKEPEKTLQFFRFGEISSLN